MKKIFIALYLFTNFSFLACGQQHQLSEKWLTNFQNIEKKTVVLNNDKELLPFINLEKKKIATIDLGFSHSITFDSLANKFAKIDHFNANVYLAKNDFKVLVDELKFYNTVILCLSDVSVFNSEVLDFIKEMEQKKQIVIALFGDGRSLTKLNEVEAPIIWCPQHNDDGANFTAQLVFGGTSTSAKLVNSYSDKYQTGMGKPIEKIRLKYTVPEEVGVNSDALSQIEEIANEAIREKAAPGMVVLVAKDGKVIFNKAFGSHTYQKELPTQVDDIFDLASITKISATTLEVMRLYEQGKLNLDTTISTYLARTRNSDKQNIKVKEVMLHQAGFIPFIPFYNDIKPEDFSRDSTETYSLKVADSFYMKKEYYKDVMWKRMVESPIRTRGNYVYSDLSMYFMQEIVETISQTPLENAVQNNFYQPLGMQTTGFNPRYRFSKSQIVPTENDSYFRKTLLWGYVHDQGAAMAGGVAGHAGLFSNATDLATLYQMLLNRGTYGGERFFKTSTVDLFTAKQSDVSRRGLGFDRWDPDTKKGYPSKLASPQTYGHTGYTGTCVWVDPKENLVYILLANRVNPTVNDKFLNLSIRPRIQDIIYQAIAQSKK